MEREIEPRLNKVIKIKDVLRDMEAGTNYGHLDHAQALSLIEYILKEDIENCELDLEGLMIRTQFLKAGDYTDSQNPLILLDILKERNIRLINIDPVSLSWIEKRLLDTNGISYEIAVDPELELEIQKHKHKRGK